MNDDLLERIRMLESLCENMKLEVASLKEENQKLKTQNNKDNKIENANRTIYETDEEKVAAETGWIVEKRKSKKRKAESSPEIIQIIQPISNKKLEKTSKTMRHN